MKDEDISDSSRHGIVVNGHGVHMGDGTGGGLCLRMVIRS